MCIRDSHDTDQGKTSDQARRCRGAGSDTEFERHSSGPLGGTGQIMQCGSITSVPVSHVDRVVPGLHTTSRPAPFDGYTAPMHLITNQFSRNLNPVQHKVVSTVSKRYHNRMHHLVRSSVLGSLPILHKRP